MAGIDDEQHAATRPRVEYDLLDDTDEERALRLYAFIDSQRSPMRCRRPSRSATQCCQSASWVSPVGWVRNPIRAVPNAGVGSNATRPNGTTRGLPHDRVDELAALVVPRPLDADRRLLRERTVRQLRHRLPPAGGAWLPRRLGLRPRQAGVSEAGLPTESGAAPTV